MWKVTLVTPAGTIRVEYTHSTRRLDRLHKTANVLDVARVG
jgi:hypothetical protein